jgi:molybdenum cofactor cytidylyltransferase
MTVLEPLKKTFGVLLAAGRGRRMGGNKQFHLVPTSAGEKPLVAAAFDTIAAVCDSMFVVLGHRAEEVAAALGERKFQIVESDPDAPMFQSIQAGLRAPLNVDLSVSILLQLGDHPALDEITLEKLFASAVENPDKVVMPTYQDNGGHPVLIPSAVAKIILATDCPDGLRQFWIDHADLCMRIRVDDLGVIRNINA